ncbi:MAG: hypothetical protein ACUVS1_10875 [Actinomycetota bacterium]
MITGEIVGEVEGENRVPVVGSEEIDGQFGGPIRSVPVFPHTVWGAMLRQFAILAPQIVFVSFLDLAEWIVEIELPVPVHDGAVESLLVPFLVHAGAVFDPVQDPQPGLHAPRVLGAMVVARGKDQPPACHDQGTG